MRSESTIDDLAPAMRPQRRPPRQEPVDLVSIGCPHASVGEIAPVAQRGRRTPHRAELWVTTSQRHRDTSRRPTSRPSNAPGAASSPTRALVVAPVDAAGLSDHGHQLGQNGLLHALRTRASRCALAPWNRCIEAAVSGAADTRAKGAEQRVDKLRKMP